VYNEFFLPPPPPLLLLAKLGTALENFFLGKMGERKEDNQQMIT
jgi:hypothetical protein